MIAALQKAQADGRQGMAASFSATTSTAPIEWLMPTVISLGGKILKEDGSAAFQGPETERVLQLFHDLSHKHKLMPVETALLQSDDAQNLAIAGKAAAHAQGSHRLTTIQERSPAGAQWTFAAFPAVEKGQPTPLSIQGWNLAIPASGQEPAARLEAHRALDLQGGAARTGGKGRLSADAALCCEGPLICNGTEREVRPARPSRLRGCQSAQLQLA
jgi:ABC-type glycerol-3-phosphate transport system substrate-binding protein